MFFCKTLRFYVKEPVDSKLRLAWFTNLLFCRVPPVEKDADPSASIMNMMKKMYDEGDDDMKRTIAKAWTESRDKMES